VAANTGWVNVGTDGDTAAFAVESIRRWWQAVGQPGYPGAGRLLITADAGGSNGCPLLAQLLGVNRTTISRAIQQTRPLLDQHGLATAGPPATRLHTLAGISAYAASHGIMPQPEPKAAC
jgi:hypothetical protein